MRYCRDKFFDANLTWHTDNPNLTECMMDTLMVAIPSATLVILAVINIVYEKYIHHRVHIFPTPEKRAWLCWTKLILNLLLVVNVSAELILRTELLGKDHLALSDLFHPICLFVTFFFVFLLMKIESRMQLHTSVPLFTFWLLLAICFIPNFKWNIERFVEGKSNAISLVITLTFWPVVLVMVILNCLSEIPGSTDDAHEPPEYRSSFASGLFFNWLGKLIRTGYRKSLVMEDLPKCPQVVEVDTNVNAFMQNWNDKVRRLGISFSTGQRLRHETPKTVSIWGVLIKTYWKKTLGTVLIALVHYTLTFVFPWILRLLINHVNSEEQAWKGIFYTIILFINSSLWTITFHQYCQSMIAVSIQLRNAMLSAVYRKSLRLSNDTRRKFTIGEITNLMSVDAERVQETFQFVHQLWTAPYTIILALFFLYQEVGVAAFAGIAVLILLLPANIWGGKKAEELEAEQMEKKDSRIKLMSEILNGIKVLKLYAWELPFMKAINNIRGTEITVLKKVAKLTALANFTYSCSPFLVTLTVFTLCVLINPAHVMTADKIFVSLSLFNIMRLPLVMFPWALIEGVKLVVSLKRINKFLNSEEIDPDCIGGVPSKDELDVEIRDGHFGWTSEEDAATLKNIDLAVPKGSFVAVVGVVGCGKSSLLSAMLGEMDVLQGHVARRGTVAFVPQQAWIQNMSLKNNVVFENHFSQSSYDSVLDACALRADLKMLTAGDETEIGENGINLSGGQKQRISLARAVYSDADVYLLDDPLSAVDAHVGKHLFEHVFSSRSGLLRRKTRIMVTHNINYLDQVDQIIVIRDGEIKERGTYDELIEAKGAFAEFLVQHRTELDTVERQSLRTASESSDHELIPQETGHHKLSSSYDCSAIVSDHDEVHVRRRQISLSIEEPRVREHQDEEGETARLIEDETAERGQVRMSVYLYYFRSIGWPTIAICLFLFFGGQGLRVSGNFWLSKWADANDKNRSCASDNSQLYLIVYTVIGTTEMLMEVVRELLLFISCATASRIIHDKLLNQVLHSPMSFFDTNPTGRIINRFSSDMDIVDMSVPYSLSDLLYSVTEVLGILVIVSYSTPIFMTVIIPLAVVYYFIQGFYISSSRQLKRLESISRSPIFAHFNETVQGISCVRAYGVQERFIRESEAKMGENVQCRYLNLSSNRWLGTRTETIGNFVIMFASIFAVLNRSSLSAGLAGLSITYALNMTDALNWTIRMMCLAETNAVSLERISEYTNNDQEAEWENQNNPPPSYWPDQGQVVLQDYQTRYRPGLDLVLKHVNLRIASQEKVGICGRTGAGKSSLTLALFRLIEPAGGRVIIDGIDTSTLGLHQLRSKLTIIPQDPVLFTGTLRFNLDPTGEKSDADIWRTLEHAHLNNHVSALPKGLDHPVSERGENFSVGQRQLICLARALLRKTKILVLDEATAAVDLETDALIQATIRREFGNCTVITIAHRLNTILDSDKIVVLNAGQVEEMGKPDELLQNPRSALSSMIAQAGM